VFKEGNAAGVAVGQPGNYQNISANATVVEAFYRYNVNNNISVTPGIFYISNNQALGNQNGSVGGVIQTQFNF
jgi:carbohydrate-selective porin OprB